MEVSNEVGAAELSMLSTGKRAALGQGSSESLEGVETLDISGRGLK